jgi:uncharacterized protein
MGTQRQAIGGGRWRFAHGPIHCVVQADGEPDAVAAALEAAWLHFQPLLAELARELPLLRCDLQTTVPTPQVNGPVARRMFAACLPHARTQFITAMAAVAGAVADELITCFDRPGITRAYVNNGGDMALHLAPGSHWDIGLIAGLQASPYGHFKVTHADAVRGVATSGWRGRSMSFGIADAVTVLATNAAQADAAATLVANAVNVADSRIERRPARELRDDSDLAHRLVTTNVPALGKDQFVEALAAGVNVAREFHRQGLLTAAALSLQGQHRLYPLDAP